MGASELGRRRDDATKTRVLILTAYPAIGGPLPKLAPLVADGLRACGCDVKTTGWSAHRAGRETLLAKVVGRSTDLCRVLRVVRDWRPQAVYVVTSHNWTALLRDIPLVLCIPQARRRVVLHFHGSESRSLAGPGRRLFKLCSGLAVRRAAAVLLLSHEELAEWRSFCPDVRFEVVLNPFVRATAPSSDRHTADGFTLLFMGRLIAEKGVFDLLEAMRLLAGRRDCRLLIAGAGPRRADVECRIADLQLGDRVSVLGYVSGTELERAFRAADVFVLPTYFAEGFPLVIMEAMSYGLPIVTTPIRGCADHLVAGRHALFVPPRRPAVLADGIDHLLGDETLRQTMSQANLAKVAEFSPDIVMPHYAEILRAVTDDAAAFRG